MTIDGTLKDVVLGDASIAALVGTRMYPIRLPQKAVLPAITYQLVSDVREAHLRGQSGLSRARYQVDFYAATHGEATTLGALGRQRLDTYRASVNDGGSPAGTFELTIFFDTSIDLYDPDINGGSCRHSADYFVVHGTAGGTV